MTVIDGNATVRQAMLCIAQPPVWEIISFTVCSLG
jgi:hypothetical protein